MGLFVHRFLYIRSVKCALVRTLSNLTKKNRVFVPEQKYGNEEISFQTDEILLLRCCIK